MEARTAAGVAAVAAALCSGLGIATFRAPGSGADRALQEAARLGDLPGVEAALARGADPNFRLAPSRFEAWTAETPNAEFGYTALHYGAISAHPEVVAALVAAKADLNARSLLGNTPLMLAVGQLDLASAEVLMKAGADRTLLNEDAKSAYDFAQKRNMSESARRLSEMLRPRGRARTAAKRPEGRKEERE